MKQLQYILIVVLLFSTFGVDAYSSPPYFIANKGQWDAAIQYKLKFDNGNVYFSSDGFLMEFWDGRQLGNRHKTNNIHQPEGGIETYEEEILQGSRIKLQFLNGHPVEVIGEKAIPYYHNYFLNNDQTKWASSVPLFHQIIYKKFYEGIDLQVYMQGPHIKYDWIVSPGADASQIKWQYSGQKELLPDNGNIYAKSDYLDITEQKPVAWQIINGKKIEIAVEFVMENNVLHFHFPNGYNSCEKLIIDPLLIFSTFSGATADNWGSTATPGERGTAYSSGVVRDVYVNNNGITINGNLPKTEGSFQQTIRGGFDIAIFKYDSTGRNLLWATYYGGSANDSPHSLIMNEQEELILLGTTSSENFPVTANAPFKNFRRGSFVSPTGIPFVNGSDIVLARINKNGTQLLSSTFFGGTKNDGLNPSIGPLSKNYGDEQRGDIAIDDNGNIFIATVSSSSDLPLVNGADLTFNGATNDGLLLKFNSTLTQLIWGRYIGGIGEDALHSIKLRSDGNLVIGGGTTSVDFPVSATAFQPGINAEGDGWIAVVNPMSSEILNCTYTGTNRFDQVYFVDIDANNNVYVYGQTAGAMDITPGTFSNPNSGQFIQSFNPDLTTRRFSTVFGSGNGIPNISPTAFSINDCGYMYMAGWGGAINQSRGYWNSNTSNMPTTVDAQQRITSGNDFYFMVLTENASQLLYATFLGGFSSSVHVDGGTSRFDKRGIVYHAVCGGCGGRSDFPTTQGAWSRVNNSGNCNNAVFKFDLSTLKAILRTNNELRTQPGLQAVCLPDKVLFENKSIGGEIFEWNMGDGTTIVKTDTLAFLYQFKDARTTPYTVTLTARDEGTCQVVDQTSIQILVSIPQVFIPDDDAICEGDNFTIAVTGNGTFNWTSKPPGFTSDQRTPIVSPTETTRYIVDYMEQNGCKRKDSLQVRVIQSLIPELKLSSQSLCIGAALFNAEVEEFEVDNYRYEVLLGDGRMKENGNFTFSYENDGVYTITVRTFSEFCVFQEVRQVESFSLFLPNIITPGIADDKNDTFVVLTGQSRVPVQSLGKQVIINIVNRWGKRVYQSDSYQNDWSGEGLPAGVYYYEVQIPGFPVCKDWVQIVK